MTHELKCFPAEFKAALSGTKRHEVRRFDRPFKTGDLLMLREWNPATESYSGPQFAVLVTYITEPGSFGLPPDIGVLSIHLLG